MMRHSISGSYNHKELFIPPPGVVDLYLQWKDIQMSGKNSALSEKLEQDYMDLLNAHDQRIMYLISLRARAYAE